MLKPNLNLPDQFVSRLNERTFVVRRWNWDYKLAWDYQKFAVNLVNEIAGLRILICTNHPHVFTNGRGLQKPRKGEVLELKEFDRSTKLPYPFYQIERGGGLTFHHPGQFIFYPIVKLNPQKLSLSKMTSEIFDFSAEILKSWGVAELSHEHKLMGLWHGNRKLASMGIAIEKLTTFHGMALNIHKDDEMKRALQTVNPCGLDSSVYISAEELTTLPTDAINAFTDKFLEKITHGWQ